jgi:hypothetical protein
MTVLLRQSEFLRAEHARQGSVNEPTEYPKSSLLPRRHQTAATTRASLAPLVMSTCRHCSARKLDHQMQDAPATHVFPVMANALRAAYEHLRTSTHLVVRYHAFQRPIKSGDGNPEAERGRDRI